MKKLLLFSLIIPVHLFAQEARVKNYTTKLEGVVVLKDVEDKYGAAVYHLEAPVPDGDADKIRLRKAKEETSEMFPRRADRARGKVTAVVPAPVVQKGYFTDSLPGIPPDNDMAISRDYKAVSVVNSYIAVLDGYTGQMLYRKTLKAFSLSVGLNNLLNDNRYDPKVQYDPDADRFICIMLNGRDQFNYIVVGFSLTNDPAGAWSFYKFYGDYNSDTTWFDYPGVVLTKDELILTGNKIKFGAPWETGFTETVIYQINKKDGYDSAAVLNYRIWDGIRYNGKGIRNLFPVRPGRSIRGPEVYFLSNRNFDVQNDTVFLVKMPGTLSSSNKTLDMKVLKSPVKYGVPPNGRQPDTSAVLATNDGRVLGAYMLNGEIQFVSTTVNPANGGAAIFHGRIKNYDSIPALDYAYIYGVDSLDFGYPNIQYAGDSCGENYSVISFDYTGPKTYPGLGAILHFNGSYSDLVKVKEGDNSIRRLTGKDQRWGDYTGAQVDFGDTSSVWIAGIFGRQNRNYGNWMAKIGNPLKTVNCMKEEEIVTPKLYPNPALAMVTYEFNMAGDGEVRFVIFGSDGRKVDEILRQNLKKGRNMIQFNTGALSGGIYFLKGIDQSGKEVVNQRFLKL